MLRYVASRLVQGLVVVVGAIAISFLLVNLTGNPADVIWPPSQVDQSAREISPQHPPARIAIRCA